MNIDLHTHSNASDGVLSPAELLNASIAAGIELFSITDHDTLDGYFQVEERSRELRDTLTLVPGVELSSHWQGVGVHIVGLGFDPRHPAINEAIAIQGKARRERGELIAQKLQKRGIDIDLARVRELAGRSEVGRPHFAQHLVEIGAAADESQAFKKWLGKSKVGDVKNTWAPIEQVVSWINDAGGVAVLAHPLKYQLTNSKLRCLLEDFQELGGRAIEVISGSQTRAQTNYIASLTDVFGFYASAGSDFHRPEQSWAKLGQVEPLPRTLNPVWELFQ